MDPSKSAILDALVPVKAEGSNNINRNANDLPLLKPPTVANGTCNADWPQDSTSKRFIWVVEYLISQVQRSKQGHSLSAVYQLVSRHMGKVS